MTQPGRRAILFDLDGTLIDSARITAAIIDAMLAARGSGHRADPALVRAMDAQGGETMIAAVMGPACSDPGAAIAEFRARHADWPTPPDLAFPGVAAALATLAADGHAMAICSNKPQPLCEKLLSNLGLGKYFVAIVGSRPGAARKPAPEPLLHTLALMGAGPAGSVYVGDSAIDAEAAAAAGTGFAMAGWGYASDPAVVARAHAAPVLADPAAMVQWVRDGGKRHAACRRA